VNTVASLHVLWQSCKITKIKHEATFCTLLRRESGTTLKVSPTLAPLNEDVYEQQLGQKAK